jgi:hypothetical protein
MGSKGLMKEKWDALQNKAKRFERRLIERILNEAALTEKTT